MKLCVIGCGYIGLPTATMFAASGCEVLAVDVSEKVVSALNKGKICIEEPGLDEAVQEVVERGRLRASQKPEPADAYIIAVPTPNNDDEFKSCDLSIVLAAIESAIPYFAKGNLVIIESTIAPRSMDDYIVPLVEEAGFVVGEDIFLAHCPERVLPGQILYELVNNNRIVGGISAKCTKKASELYSLFVKGEILETEAKTAELAKCMENTFRDVNIALANELAIVCNELEINCLDVISLANKHPRVNIHNPGPGVGGHCLAVDPYFIHAKCPEYSKIIKLARDTNTSMPAYIVGCVEEILRDKIDKDDDVRIACFGATYKGNVDDCRESPALHIFEMLKSRGYGVDIYDPYAEIDEKVSASQAAEGSDLLLVLVDHDEFKGSQLFELAMGMEKPLIFDTCNIVSKCSDITVLNLGNIYEYKLNISEC